MLASLISLLAVGMLVLAAYGIGRPILRGLSVAEDDALSIGAWSLVLGLIVAGTLLAALGMAGLLYGPLVGVLSMAAALWGLGELVIGVGARHAPGDTRELGLEWPAPTPWLRRGAFLLAAVAAGASLVSALAPPIAGDALCYHLELPKAFLAGHAITYLPYHDNSTFPLLVEMWYLWGLAVEGPVAAQLVHWLCGLLLAAGTVLLARPVVGHSWAWLAGLVALLVPGVNNEMTAPLNDVALAMLTTYALAAWWRVAIDDADRRWALLAGLAGGGALGTKYLAGLFALAVAIHACVLMVRQPERRGVLLQAAAGVAVVAASLGGPWYVRAAWHRGNPVYPFLNEAFDRTTASGESPQATLPAGKSPLGRNPLYLPSSAWHITMEPERFGGRGHQLGAIFLACLPGLALARRLRGLSLLLGVAGAYYAGWFLLRQNVRFLFPVVPLLAVAVVWVWMETRRWAAMPRRVAAVAVAALLCFSAAVPAARCRNQLAVAAGLESRADYLRKREPTYTAAEAARAMFGPDAHLLSQDFRTFYFPCRTTRENVYRRETAYDRQITDPASLSRRLQQAGFTHLLLAETLSEGGIAYDPTLSRLADAQAAAGAGDDLITLTRYQVADADGAVRQYRLVLLH